MKLNNKKRPYKRKSVKISHDRFFYSPNLLDLSEKEIPIIEITKQPSRASKFFAILKRVKLKKHKQGVDFLKAGSNWKIPKVVGKKIINKVNDLELPKFLDKLVYSKNSRIHKKLQSIGLNFEKHPMLNKLKKTLVFLLVCIIILLPIQGVALAQKFKYKKAEIMAHGMEGYDYLKQAQVEVEKGNFTEAQKSFEFAENKFHDAEKEIGWWRVFIPVTRFVVKESSAYYLLKSAKIISQTGSELTGWVVDLKNDMSVGHTYSKNLDFKSVLLRVKELSTKQRELEEKIQRVEGYVAMVDASVLDPEQIKKIEPAKAKILRFLDILEVLPSFLGQDGLQRYLVVFQNSNEIRATGGFMGSLALIDVVEGRITNIEIPGGGPYDLRAGFKDYIQTPQPLWRIKTRWEIQDANWWPDFPTSAKKIAWFYENSDQPTVDGVIAVNSDILPELLKVFGPITLSKYGKTVTTDNFYEVTQYQVEVDYDKEENKPKQFIADLFFEMLDRLIDNFSLKNKKELVFVTDVLKQFDQSLIEKDIQIYLRNENLEEKIIQIGAAGEMKSADADSLMLVNTNIGGGKTDEFVDQNVSLSSKVQADNSIINTLKITRKHNGGDDYLFEELGSKNYMRVYVPHGSVLIEAIGFTDSENIQFRVPTDFLKADEHLFEIEKNEYYTPDGTRVYEENKKTVFANWVDLDVGQTRTVMIKYKLPFKFDPSYNLYLQKQSGSRSIIFDREIVYSDGKVESYTIDLEDSLVR